MVVKAVLKCVFLIPAPAEAAYLQRHRRERTVPHECLRSPSTFGSHSWADSSGSWSEPRSPLARRRWSGPNTHTHMDKHVHRHRHTHTGMHPKQNSDKFYLCISEWNNQFDSWSIFYTHSISITKWTCMVRYWLLHAAWTQSLVSSTLSRVNM